MSSNQPVPPARTGAVAVALRTDQSTALEQILAHLDQPLSSKVIALLGARGSGKTALTRALLGSSGQLARTAKGRRVISVVIDLLRLSEDLPEWQALLFTLLEALSRQPNPHPSLEEIAAELVQVAHLETRLEDGADLALAAFVHRFRTVFAEALVRLGAPNSAVLLVVIDHLDKARPDRALGMLEAARYFLSRQECAILACAQENTLADDVRDALRGWMTARVDLREAPTSQPTPTRTAASPRPKQTRPAFLQDLPPACADLFLEYLGNSRYLMTRAVEHWRAAMRVLVRRGERYDLAMAVLVAQLCLLRELSPALFDAAALDIALLPDLEQRVRGGSLLAHHPWASVIDHDERLHTFFAQSAGFIGVEPWTLAAAVRAVQHASAEPTPAPQSKRSFDAAARATSTELPVERPSSAQTTPAAQGHLWRVMLVAAGSFALDRLTKLIAEANGGVVLSLQGALGAPLDLVASMAVDLSSLMLCAVLLVLWPSRRRGIYGLAYGLLFSGLLANLADRLVYGAVMHLFRLGTLPMFNLAHVCMLVGAGLLAWALVSRADKNES